MSRWLVFSQNNDSYRLDNTSSKPYNADQIIEALPTGELNNNTFEGKEEDWKLEQRKNDEGANNEQRPYITISNGSK